MAHVEIHRVRRKHGGYSLSGWHCKGDGDSCGDKYTKASWKCCCTFYYSIFACFIVMAIVVATQTGGF